MIQLLEKLESHKYVKYGWVDFRINGKMDSLLLSWILGLRYLSELLYWSFYQFCGHYGLQITFSFYSLNSHFFLPKILLPKLRNSI